MVTQCVQPPTCAPNAATISANPIASVRHLPFVKCSRSGMAYFPPLYGAGKAMNWKLVDLGRACDNSSLTWYMRQVCYYHGKWFVWKIMQESVPGGVHCMLERKQGGTGPR